MTHKTVSDPVKPEKNQRQQHRESRLKVALKANMAKRKAQVKARDDENSVGMTGDGNDKG